MAIYAVNELPQERTTTFTVDERKHNRKFLVKSNNRYTGSYEAASSVGINIGNAHPEDGYAFCESVTATPYSGPLLWHVTASYTTKNEFQENPLNEPARISWSTEQYQKVAWKDRNGDAIVNSAGDPFDPPSMKDFSRRVARVTKNIASEPVWLLDYEDAVNSAAFSIRSFAVAAELAKLQRIEISETQTRGVYDYHVLSFEIHLSKDGWKEERLQEGFRRKDGSDRIPIYEKDEDGNETTQKITAPVPLNAAGAVITNPTPTNVVYTDFELYNLLDFSVLPLT